MFRQSAENLQAEGADVRERGKPVLTVSLVANGLFVRTVRATTFVSGHGSDEDLPRPRRTRSTKAGGRA